MRFGASGLVTTGVNGAIFIPLSHPIGYAPAAVTAWVISVAVGFQLNRRFTFRLSGREGRNRQLVLFVAGALAQLLLSLASYALLIGRLHMPATPAFAMTLIVTTAFSFIVMNLIVFRAAPARSSSA